ncbi:hypothetical protein Ccrd_025492 [Cynara cardunculus var. scolymus]|uniref:Disease resistance protein n=1 Tax=Cynara cardunculus var. scolymus TaxID=59895 RepID=A0A124S8A4_CYNCS|nr:hypothetical protein Ccrd_025492 [Cynara cardunculus var. scolymus]
MAEILLSPILQVLAEKLGSAAFKKLARYSQIHIEVNKWETSLTDIQALLNDASQKEIRDEYIKGWLNRFQHLTYDIDDILEHLTYDIDDILDNLATDAMHRKLIAEELGAISSKVRMLIPTCSTSFSANIRMHDKLKDITTKLQDLEKEKVTLGLSVINGRPITMSRNYETSLPDASDIVGRQGEKEALLHKLLWEESINKNINIVPIVGKGGLGKTTLARLLYNETQVQNHFKLKAWVCVSDEFDIFTISKSIFASVTGENKEFQNVNQVQEDLRKQVTDKRFLLVLDDVWSESYEDWNTFVRPFHAGALGSKIVITTRKEQLLRELGCDNLEHLQSLSYDDALSLFCQHALGVSNFDSHPNLRPYGEGIVKKCDGLPLGLRVLGRLLRTKADEVEWKELLSDEIWSLQTGDGIIPALRLSYHDLSACLKRLFAYCSLFPKHYLFEKEELILLWMAEGFLHHSRESMSTVERLGHNYFKQLLSRSFFQKAPNEDSLFLMHDLMNDLATSVAGEFFWRSEDEMEKGVGMDTLEKYRHLSFVCERFISDKKLKAFIGAKNLRTFLAVSFKPYEEWDGFFLSNKILDDLLHEFPLLRVLYLACLHIITVPKSIGSLKHLRYLNLGQTKIRYLPENVCNLYNLQTLIVFGCHELTKLPNSFSKLTSLRHFDIRDTPLLNKMPSGIGELKNLQTLSKITIGGADEFPLTKLKDLKNLHEMICIKGLDKVQNAMHAREANLLQMRLRELEVEWSDVFDGSRDETLENMVLDVLNPGNENLEKLNIVSYGGIKFPNWGWEVWSYNGGVVDPVYPCLGTLRIKGCPKLVEISVEELPSLRDLEIDECSDGVLRRLVQVASSITKLKIVSILGLTDQLWGGVMKHLGVVEEVIIERCDEIRYVWESETEACKVLVNLRKLEMRRCNNLVRLGEKEEDHCGSKLTSLTMLDIWFCGRMEHCSCSNSIKSLFIFGCDSITSISFPTGGKKQLKSCSIYECKKLLEKEFGGGRSEETINASMWMLDTRK